MRLHKLQWAVIVLLLLMLATSSLAAIGLPLRAASAQLWSQPLGGMNTAPVSLLSDPDGLTVGTCSSAPVIQHYAASDGTLSGSAQPTGNILPCLDTPNNTSAVDAQGNLYTVAASTTPNDFNGHLVAYAP